MSEIIFKSTAAAQRNADTIKKAAYGFEEFSTKMDNIKKKIESCWEGDSQDIEDITSDLYFLTYNARLISRCLQELSLGLSAFATAVDEVGKGKGKSFWSEQKQEFANDWDYSQCDGVLDYVGSTVRGVLGTVGSSVNFITDAVGEVFKWIL